MIPNAVDIEYFLEVCRTKNLSRAAERIGIAQPSLSLAIQRLETTTGERLLHRSRKGVELTPAGKVLFRHSQALLQQWKDLSQSIHASQDSIQGSYTIGCHPSVGIYSLHHFLPQALRDNPELNINIKYDLSRKITERVVSLDIEVGVVINPYQHPDLVINKIFEDDVCLWQASSSKKFNEGVLICDPDLLQTQDLLKKYKAKGFKFKRFIHSSNLEVIAQLTSQGCGFGIIPARVAQAMVGKKVKKVQTAPSFKDQLAVIYHIDNKSVASIEYLAKHISHTLKSH